MKKTTQINDFYGLLTAFALFMAFDIILLIKLNQAIETEVQRYINVYAFMTVIVSGMAILLLFQAIYGEVKRLKRYE